MGKTTLLNRVFHAIEDDESLASHWMPICFSEEQYNIGELADLWLNALEQISELEQSGEESTKLKDLIEDMVETYRGEELEEVAYRRLREVWIQKRRRLLLLVDNLDLVLDRIDSDREAHTLRKALQSDEWLLLIGASSHPIEATYEYDKPFYEQFQLLELHPLSRDEMEDLLVGLGRYSGRELTLRRIVEERRGLLDVLHCMTDGNVRTTTVLFSILAEHPEADLRFLMGRLLDQQTSFYKGRIEALPPQGQRVFDSLARHGNPSTAEDIAREIRIERGVASAQLHRLAEKSLVRKQQTGAKQPLSFEVRDRLFNLWYLMRSGRRQRQQMWDTIAFLSLLVEPAKAPSPQEELLADLHFLGLADTMLTAQLDREVADLGKELRMQALQDQHQLALGSALSAPQKARTLALFYHGQYQDVADLAVGLLAASNHQHTAFATLCQARALELLGRQEDALLALRMGLDTAQVDFFRLEQARLLIALGRSRDAQEVLLRLTLSQTSLPPGSLADLALAAAHSGEAELAMAGNLLVGRARRQAPENLSVLLTSCEIEMLLHRPAEAMGHLEQGIVRLAPASWKDTLPPGAGAVLETIFRVARSMREEALSSTLLPVLETTGLGERWRPLAHALAHLGGDEDRLGRLAPEIQTYTRMVEERIRPTETLAGAPA